MKKKVMINGLLICVVLSLSFCGSGRDSILRSSDPPGSNVVDGIRYESGNWAHPDYAKPFKSPGNHRFVVEFKGEAEAVRVDIPWRRGDINPSEKAVVIINKDTGLLVEELLVREITNEAGSLIFKPATDGSMYHVYYLPHESTGGYYPKVKYLTPPEPADSPWQVKYGRLGKEQVEELPEARILAAQSIDDFHSFFPMEIIATRDEVDAMIQADPRAYYLFPEYRRHSIRMTDYLPKHWVDRGIKTGISDGVKRGEFYTFQIGLYSPGTDLRNIDVSTTDLTSGGGDVIGKERFHSFNTAGIDLNGDPFTKTLNVKKGQVQATWFGIDIPEDAIRGRYRGQVVIQPRGMEPRSIEVELDISAEQIPDHGDDQPEMMSRLRWLNSTLGTDKNFIPAPHIPVEVGKDSLRILGREIVLGRGGLLSQIHSFFPRKMTSIGTKGEPILAGPVSFKVVGKGGHMEEWRSSPFAIEQTHRSEAHWTVLNESDSFNLRVEGRLEFDGALSYRLILSGKRDFEAEDIRLVIPMQRDAAVWMVGLGRKGGRRPDAITWNWDVNYHQEGVWLGNINKGLQWVLRDNNYERPLNTNFYRNKPLKLPVSWGNRGKGGIRIFQRRGRVIAENFCGDRLIQKGEALHFHIRFLITPFKSLNIKRHFNTRFVHKYVPVEQAQEWGGTVINVHHAHEINPYINYPFYNLLLQKEYIEKAHSRGIKVKLYNTIRELTYRAHELFALKSLGDEIFNDGEGGGHTWLQEHLRSNYHSAWHATSVNDAAILNKGTSRWTNYYIEGLNWLAKNQKIDGLYLDDIAFSRETVKRIVTVLNKHRDEVIIDLHSANQYNPRDGFINSVFLYMEHLPYISRLWFGEYFDYNENPDFWLTEVSGIPFGLTGEMLEKGGHPYRGMVFGMTNRIYHQHNPRALWKLFDDFDIANSEMIGYWVESSPVKINNKNILLTVYRHPDRALLALGSWSPRDEAVVLNIDWDSLGLDKNSVRLNRPGIKGLQEQKQYDHRLSIKVAKNEGLILILE